MEFYLFDTNVISDLFNPHRTNHQAVRRELNGLPSDAPKFISVIVLGELRFGLHLAKQTGQELSHIRNTIEQAEEYPLTELTNHTADTYGFVKSCVANRYVDLNSRLPRFIEDWKDRITGRTLGISENDLWIAAQAMERNFILLTSDTTMVDRISAAIPEFRFRVPNRS